MADSAWASFIGPLVASLLGGGGIVGILNWRSQKKRGIRQEDRADDDAMSRRAQDLIKTQFEMLVQPLQAEVGRLREEVVAMKLSLDMQRNRYWRLITYTRSLRLWGSAHVKPEAPKMPDPPSDLSEDL